MIEERITVDQGTTTHEGMIEVGTEIEMGDEMVVEKRATDGMTLEVDRPKEVEMWLWSIVSSLLPQMVKLKS